jgi:hypothetical protein
MWYWDLGRGCSFAISDGDVVLGYRTGMWVFGGSRMGMWFWGSRMGMTKKRPWRWRKRFCEPSVFVSKLRAALAIPGTP